VRACVRVWECTFLACATPLLVFQEHFLESYDWSTRTVDSRRQLAPVLEPNTSAQRISFTVTSIALHLGHLGPRLLDLEAQFLIGSPGTLIGIKKLPFYVSFQYFK